MKCPYCKYEETKVLETREAEGNTRRRRECLKCNKRFTTYEQVELMNLFILKKNGEREAFDKQKLVNGMIRACEKRPVTFVQIEEIAEDIETKLLNHKKNEVKSTHIGEMVMRRLKKIDTIAYIRFASVYREFTDLHSFQDEVKQLINEKQEVKKSTI